MSRCVCSFVLFFSSFCLSLYLILQIQKEGSTFRSTARPTAEAISLREYELEPEDHKAGDYLPEDLRVDAELLAEEGSFLHIYKKDGVTIHRNWEHPGIETFCIKFYYKGSKALAKLYSHQFRHSLPPRALAFGCIAVCVFFFLVGAF